MKSLLTLTLLALVSTSSAFAAAGKRERLQGEYSRPTFVVDFDSATKKECKAKKNRIWENGVCLMPSKDSASVQRIANKPNAYFVKISVVSTRLNMCDFAEEFKLEGDKLTFKSSDDDSSVVITRKGSNLVVQDNEYSISHCGHNAYIGGEYKRSGVGSSTTVEEIAADCGQDCE